LGVLRGKILPGIGLLFCLSIWVNLSKPALVMGGVWFVAGLVFHLIQRRRGESFEFTE
jgi:predicted membrane channel-forming protein YqfA (hemolysin III family)